MEILVGDILDRGPTTLLYPRVKRRADQSLRDEQVDGHVAVK